MSAVALLVYSTTPPALTIDFDGSPICAGICPSFFVVVNSDGRVQTVERDYDHSIKTRSRWRITSAAAISLEQKMASLRRLPSDMPCSELGQPAHYSLSVAWNGDRPFRYKSCNIHGERLQAECALFGAGINPLNGRKLMPRQIQIIMSMKPSDRTPFVGEEKCPPPVG